MGILGRDEILAAAGPETEVVDVPEWGGQVMVRGMSGADRDKYEAMMFQIKGRTMVPNLANARARLVCMCVVDEHGNLLLTPQDADRIGELSAAALDRVHRVAQRLSGMSDEDIEEMTRDFTSPSGSDSSTGSQNGSARRSRSSSASSGHGS